MRIRFQRGSAYIDVKIEGRILEFTTPLLNFVPIKINLDKLEEHKDRLERMNFDKELLEHLANLHTEQEMAFDLIEDLKKGGWRYHVLR